MSAQLEILIIDRNSNTIRNSIQTMMFEGVSKDDVNYHLLLYSKSPSNSNRKKLKDHAENEGDKEQQNIFN